MKKEIRKNIDAQTLHVERAQIAQFVAENVRVAPGAHFFIHDAYDRYQWWLKTTGLPKTVVSVSGFGRLFPEQFKRIVLSRGERVQRGVKDALLRDM
jgi:hypothetical protein